MDACDSRHTLSAFPITAMVGGDKLIEALALGLISPDIHSVLICGPSGTGKSVAARSVRNLVPDLNVVELPANLTQDQLFGSMDIEVAIREGRRASSDSIIGRADGGVLIADNINLQSPEMIHSLMNVVQDGFALSEAGGMSISAQCDAFLIGTMNPDEGELDSHILDRFDICVYTESCAFPEDRREVIRRRLAFERDSAGFCSLYSDSEDDLRHRIVSASYGDVSVPDGIPGMISEICAAMNIEGHRGDISVLNTLRASAAFEGHDSATSNDLKRAAFLCLRHRRREDPPPQEHDEDDDCQSEDPPEESQAESGEDSDGDRTQNNRDQGGNEGSDAGSDGGQNDESDDEDDSDGGPAEDPSDKVFGIGEQFDVREYIPPESRRSRNRRSGRQDMSVSTDGSGRTVGYAIPRGKAVDVALVASICAAAPYQSIRSHSGLAVSLRKEDLREKIRVRRKSTTILFVVDGSGSMGARSRMVAVKGAILSMLYDSYRRRDTVGLVVFRSDDAEVVLPPTRSVLTAYRSLEEMPTGGRTPLGKGLEAGYRMLKKDAEAGTEPVMVVLTDGRGNVSGGGYASAEESLRHASRIISESGIRTIVVDTEAGLIRFGKARELASMMGSAYIMLEDLNADRLSSSVESAMESFGR